MRTVQTFHHIALVAGGHPGFPFLTVIILVPAGGALVTALLPKGRTKMVQAAGMATSLATLALSLAMVVVFTSGQGGYQMLSQHPWIKVLGVSWNMGVDGISVFLVMMCTVIFPITLFGARVRRDNKSFVAWMLLLEAACLGSFLSLDLLVFFLFFELTLFPTYFIVGGWGHARRQYAAAKFFIYTFAGSAFLLVGIVGVAYIHQRQTGVLTFNLLALMSTHLSSAEGILLFLAFTIAFAVKAPIFPFHTWSPDAYAEAPAGGSIALAAVMAKLGTYGIIRFDLALFPKASVDLAPLLLTLGVLGIIYGGIVAAAQRDLKRLVAYSSLAHLGFIVLGIFAFTTQGLTGGVIEMFNHGIYTAALFLLIAMIYQRRGTWDVRQLRGLQRPAPLMAAVFTVVMLAAIGLPGLNGFVGEFLILIGTFATHRWWAVVATAGVIIAAIYLLWAYQQVFHGRADDVDQAPAEPGTAGLGGDPAGLALSAGPGAMAATEGARRRFHDLSWREGLVMAPLVAIIVFVGIYPRVILDRITPSVQRVEARVALVQGHVPPGVTRSGARVPDIGGRR